MKEVNENYHFEIWIICNECIPKEEQISLNFDKFQQQQMRYRMSNYSKEHSEMRFECKKCGKLIHIKALELESKWEKSSVK